MRISLIAAATIFGTAAAADTLAITSSIGALLASETACGYTYDQGAVIEMIEKAAPLGDLEFQPMLSTMIMGHEHTLKQMSGSALLAQCAAAEQNARHYGLMD